jgi:sigma-B regulation protein RsbU (phosphoserine phosphatase)
MSAALQRPVAAPPANATSLTVLVVDDQDMQRLIVRRTLGKMGHTVLEASSAEQALVVLGQHHVDVILSDWVMDGMDGTDLCRLLRRDIERPYVYFILMSSRDTREDLLAGMQAGADDFLRKPLDVEELGVRLRAGQRVLELQSRLQARQAQLQAAYAHIQEDMDAAGVFQRGLLPKTDGLNTVDSVSWLFMPSNTVSGDALNFFALDDRYLAFYLMDVSGHGVAAAMVAMNVAQYLNPEVEGCVFRREPGQRLVLDPASAVAELNRRLCEQDIDGKYLTCIYGVLDRQTGHVQLVRAGHPMPMLIHADGSTECVGEEGDLPVALFPGIQFANYSAQLRPGSRLVLVSDGITECEDMKGEPYGEARLMQFFKSRRQEPMAAVSARFSEEIRAWRSFPAQTFQDDVSLLVVGYSPVQSSPTDSIT